MPKWPSIYPAPNEPVEVAEPLILLLVPGNVTTPLSVLHIYSVNTSDESHESPEPLTEHVNRPCVPPEPPS